MDLLVKQVAPRACVGTNESSCSDRDEMVAGTPSPTAVSGTAPPNSACHRQFDDDASRPWKLVRPGMSKLSPRAIQPSPDDLCDRVGCEKIILDGRTARHVPAHGTAAEQRRSALAPIMAVAQFPVAQFSGEGISRFCMHPPTSTPIPLIRPGGSENA